MFRIEKFYCGFFLRGEGYEFGIINEVLVIFWFIVGLRIYLGVIFLILEIYLELICWVDGVILYGVFVL